MDKAPPIVDEDVWVDEWSWTENLMSSNQQTEGANTPGKSVLPSKKVITPGKRYKCLASRPLFESEDEENVEMHYNDNCSDEEFADVRRKGEDIMREEETRINQEEARLREETEKFREEGGFMSDDSSNEELEGSDEELDGEDEEYMYQYEEDSDDGDGRWAYAEPRVAKQPKIRFKFDPTTPGRDIKFKLGMFFANKKEVKTTVREYSIANGRALQFPVDDKYRTKVTCASGCPFKIWASFVAVEQVWVIKTLNSTHNCLYQYKNKLVSCKYLHMIYGERIRKNPNWKLSEMQQEIRKDLKVEASMAMCHRVRRMALSGVKSEMANHYAGLRRFGGEILRSNPHNTVKISTTRVNENDPPHFERFYVCYAELKNAWKEGCRPVLGLDGCFLKTVCGGQLLSAVGRDGMNGIFPVAMAVVETESYASWSWFLTLFIDDLQLGSGYGYTFISDQQKGLEKAVKEFLPFVEHRNCTRHLYSNLKPKTDAVRDAFYKASMSTHPEAFKAAMKNLQKASKEAYEKMNALPPVKLRIQDIGSTGVNLT